MHKWLMMMRLMAEATGTEGGGSGTSSTETQTPSSTDETVAGDDTVADDSAANPFEALFQDDDAGGSGEDNAPVESTTVVTPAAENTPPVDGGAAAESQKTVQPPSTVTTQTPPVQQTQTTQTAQAAQAVPPAQTAQTAQAVETEAERLAQAQRLAEAHEAKLAEHYTLPAELAAQLDTEPEVVLPKLAAKVHMAVVNEVLARVNQHLPAALNSYNTMQATEAKAKSDFYSRWPGLAQYESQVLQIGAMFRQANPNASQEEALDRVGRMTYLALGLEVPGGAPIQTPPASNTVVTPPRSAGFRPATVGSGGAPVTAPVSDNPFVQLANEMTGDD